MIYIMIKYDIYNDMINTEYLQVKCLKLIKVTMRMLIFYFNILKKNSFVVTKYFSPHFFIFIHFSILFYLLLIKKKIVCC